MLSTGLWEGAFWGSILLESILLEVSEKSRFRIGILGVFLVSAIAPKMFETARTPSRV